MKTKHTKGKWVVKKKHCEDRNVDFLSIEKHVSYNTEKEDEIIDYSICGIWTTTKADEANAKLIAAAPEMYNEHEKNAILCNQMLDMLSSGRHKLAIRVLAEIKSNCINAIQKATQ